MALRPIPLATNGDGRRKLGSWIECFVDHTNNLESDPIYRKWAAISMIAAALEQKVWVMTSSPLYPNLYTFLVGHAGIGKSRTISAAVSFYRELPEPHIAPTSVTMASLVDHLAEAKRTIIHHPNPIVEYNSILIVADELSAFMHEYKGNELIPGLTTFYDSVPYSQGRRVKDIRIKINRPQVNILTGTTPSNLIQFIPDYAWEQGFTSRIVMIYADTKPILDIFNLPNKEMPSEMLHDLKAINALYGQIGWDEEWATAMHNWKLLKYQPVPEHPKLRWYCERRYSHMIKLSMIACVDRGDSLMLTKADFNKAMGWLLEAEHVMHHVFDTGSTNLDSNAMDEILHFIQATGNKGISEHRIVNFARERVPAHSVIRVIEIMERSGLIKATSVDAKTGLRLFTSLRHT